MHQGFDKTQQHQTLCRLFCQLVVFGTSICMIPLFASGCKDGGKEFRRVLRGAATSVGRSSPKKKKTSAKDDIQVKLANKNGIKQCPAEAKLRGAPHPMGQAQWCEATTKNGQAVKHGEYRRWHKKGHLKVVATYEKGQPVGTLKEWHKNGRKKREVSYAKGFRDGPSIYYHKDGTKKLEENYIQGKKNGRYGLWAKGGRIKEKGSFRDDVKVGLWVHYHRNGHVSSKVSWLEGSRNGRAQTYSRDGALLTDGGHKDDLPHGKWVTYFPNGQRKSEGTFIAGQKNGQWAEYSRKGDLQTAIVFKDGAIVQTQTHHARAKMNRKGKRKYRRFGNSDKLGAMPPIRRRSLPQSTPRAEKLQPIQKGSGWSSL